MKIILFNGPARSGKDTCANAVSHELSGVIHTKFAHAVKKGTHEFYGMKGIPIDHFEHVKEDMREEFNGKSPRQAYIEYSENHMKPLYGNDIFGVKTKDYILGRQLMDPINSKYAVISDSGFVDEAMVLVDEFGPENILLVHIIRGGFSFDGDSRNYIELDDVDTVTLHNNGVDKLEVDAIRLAKWFFERE